MNTNTHTYSSCDAHGKIGLASLGGGGDKENRYMECLDTLVAVAMRYCKRDRALAEDLAREALQAAWGTESQNSWTKSHLLSHLRSVYLSRKADLAVSGTGYRLG